MATLQSRVVDAPALGRWPPRHRDFPPSRRRRLAASANEDAHRRRRDANDDDTVPLFEIGDTPPLPLGASSVGPSEAPPPCLSAAPCSSSA